MDFYLPHSIAGWDRDSALHSRTHVTSASAGRSLKDFIAFVYDTSLGRGAGLSEIDGSGSNGGKE